MSALQPEREPLTILEKVWHRKPEEHLFTSDLHQVAAYVDPFCRLPMQAVIAPKWGNPGTIDRFSARPLGEQHRLLAVASFFLRKIDEKYPDEASRAILHIEGYGVDNHAHIIVGLSPERRSGMRMYDGNPLGEIAVQQTLLNLRPTPLEAQALETHLDAVQSYE